MPPWLRESASLPSRCRAVPPVYNHYSLASLDGVLAIDMFESIELEQSIIENIEAFLFHCLTLIHLFDQIHALAILLSSK